MKVEQVEVIVNTDGQIVLIQDEDLVVTLSHAQVAMVTAEMNRLAAEVYEHGTRGYAEFAMEA